MNIVYIGRVSLWDLAGIGKWNRLLPEVKWGFPLGSEIVFRLVSRGHNITVVTEHKVSQVEKYHCETESGSLEVWLVPCRRRTRWTFLTLFSKEVCGIISAIREVKPDVVFAQWTYHNAYAGLKSGYPCLVVAHDSPWRVLLTMRNLISFIKALYSRFIVVPKIQNLSVVSPHIGEDFMNMGYCGHMVLIGNGCSVECDECAQVVEAASKVIMVTQWGRLKNSTGMLKAWKNLYERHKGWKLVVYGNYMDEKGAEPWMRGAGMGYLIDDGAVELRGFASQETIKNELKTADLFVSPSLEESFGMVFVEAMRLGVPCVGGEKSGAVPWVLGTEDVSRSLESESNSKALKSGSGGDMQGGVVCDVTDSKKLAKCVEYMMNNFELRRRLAIGGRNRVKHMFNIEKIVEVYERELNRVAVEDLQL